MLPSGGLPKTHMENAEVQAKLGYSGSCSDLAVSTGRTYEYIKVLYTTTLPDVCCIFKWRHLLSQDHVFIRAFSSPLDRHFTRAVTSVTAMRMDLCVFRKYA